MPRKKVKIEYITDDTKRNISFKKREKGLMKKLDEISTLCGIDACAVIFNPNFPQPKVWPSEIGAINGLSRFNAMSEVDQTKKMLDQEGMLKQQILKAQEQLEKQRDDNKKKEMTCLMLQSMQNGQIVGDMSITDLNSLSMLIDENLRIVEQKLVVMQVREGVQNVGHAQGLETNMDVIQNDQPWSMDSANNIIDDVLPFGYVAALNGVGPNP